MKRNFFSVNSIKVFIGFTESCQLVINNRVEDASQCVTVDIKKEVEDLGNRSLKHEIIDVNSENGISVQLDSYNTKTEEIYIKSEYLTEVEDKEKIVYPGKETQGK